MVTGVSTSRHDLKRSGSVRALGDNGRALSAWVVHSWLVHVAGIVCLLLGPVHVSGCRMLVD